MKKLEGEVKEILDLAGGVIADKGLGVALAEIIGSG
jgi:hypothetical protein